jgi:hypothetical protein
MRARVATFEAGDPEATRKGLEEIKQRALSGPRESLPAVGLLVLRDPDQRKVLSLTLHETEEDLRAGDTRLNEMEPPGAGGPRRRVSVEMFEVGVKVDLEPPQRA